MSEGDAHPRVRNAGSGVQKCACAVMVLLPGGVRAHVCRGLNVRKPQMALTLRGVSESLDTPRTAVEKMSKSPTFSEPQILSMLKALGWGGAQDMWERHAGSAIAISRKLARNERSQSYKFYAGHFEESMLKITDKTVTWADGIDPSGIWPTIKPEVVYARAQRTLRGDPLPQVLQLTTAPDRRADPAERKRRGVDRAVSAVKRAVDDVGDNPTDRGDAKVRRVASTR